MTKEELARVISDTRNELGESADDDEDGDDDEAMETAEGSKLECDKSNRRFQFNK